ncbi:MAG TPA: hypothetical protein VN715_13315 [Roseiarcus sp.]|nr:hypothetical protein [Roseiarcus sp.]
MRGAILLAGFLFASTLAHAATMEVRPDSPVAQFTIPDDWKTSRIDRGIQAVSKDEEVDFWIEAYTPDQFQAILSEHNAYWKDQGVEISSSDSQTHSANGKEVVVTTEHAIWKGKPTVLYYIEFNLGLPSKSDIVFTYWASPEGDKTFQNEVGDVIKSLDVTEK